MLNRRRFIAGSALSVAHQEFLLHRYPQRSPILPEFRDSILMPPSSSAQGSVQDCGWSSSTLSSIAYTMSSYAEYNCGGFRRSIFTNLAGQGVYLARNGKVPTRMEGISHSNRFRRKSALCSLTSLAMASFTPARTQWLLDIIEQADTARMRQCEQAETKLMSSKGSYIA